MAGCDSSPEQSLIADLLAHGALVDVAPQARDDGERGIFATRDLQPGDMACWVPNSTVLELATVDPDLRAAISSTLAESSVSEQECAVFARMIALTAGYLLEKSKGSASQLRHYINVMPQYPQTVNTFSEQERAVLVLMNDGCDYVSMYKTLIDLATLCVERAASLWGSSSIPKREDISDTFFFVLSRMSHLRLIPLVDLANAALPQEENARIAVEDQVVNGVEGCAIVTKKAVAKGQEIVIDYNHHNAVSMLLSYGCTLGLEKTHSLTKIPIAVPPWMQGMGNLSKGLQLMDSPSEGVHACGLEKDALTMVRMAALGREETIEAVGAGFFRDDHVPGEGSMEWNVKQSRAYAMISNFCAQRRTHWEGTVAPAVWALAGGGLAAQVATCQLETELRLLKRCEDTMASMMMAGLSRGQARSS